MDFHSLNEDRIKGYCFKILRILGTWTFLLFVGSCYQLWYLGALVLAVIILSVLIKREIPLRYIMILSILLFMIGLLGESYYGFIEPLKNYSITKQIIEGYEIVFSTTRNGVFFGFVFVLLGALFAQKRIVLNNTLAYLGLIVSFILLFLEAYFLKLYSHTKGHDMYVSLLPIIFFLFYLATHIRLKNRPIYSSLRIIGMLVFFMHLFVNHFVRLGIEMLNDKKGIDISIFQFIITIFFTTMLAILIERLSKTKKFQWLKFLFS